MARSGDKREAHLASCAFTVHRRSSEASNGRERNPPTVMRDALGPWRAYLATALYATGQWIGLIAVPFSLSSGATEVIGLLGAFRFGVTAFLSFPSGLLIDRIGAPGAARFAVVGGTAATLALIFPGGFAGQVIWALVGGASGALYYPAISTQIQLRAAQGSKGASFGLQTMSVSLGMALGPALAGLLFQAYAADLTFLIASALTAIASVPIATLPSYRDHEPEPQLRSLRGLRNLHRTQGMWLAGIVIGIPWGAILLLMPAFGESISLSPSAIGSLLAIVAVVSSLIRLPAGAIIDRLRPTWLIVPALSLLASLGTILVGWQHDYAMLAITLPVAMAFIASGSLQAQWVISTTTPRRLLGTALAGYAATLSIGLGLGPFVAGNVATGGDFSTAFGVVGIIGICGSIAVAATRWTGPRALRSGSVAGVDE